MKKLTRYAATGMMIGLMGAGNAMAGQASTSASATNGWGHPGAASATANYTGGNAGQGFARTRTDTAGPVNIGRGLAVGFDENGLDVSFSHALAPVLGPAYAGTFNMSIGTNGQVASSYGGTLAQGGLVRTAEAGGTTQSNWHGATASATASGHTAPGGRVDSWTRSNSTSAVGGLVHAAPARGIGTRVAPVYGGVRPISVQRTNIHGWR